MFLSVAFDLILIGVLLVGVGYGYKRGFVKSMMKPIRFFAALTFSFKLCKSVSEVFFTPIITPSLTGQIKRYLIENFPNISEETTVEDLPTAFKVAAAVFDVDLSIQAESPVDSIVNQLSMPIVELISVVVSFIAIYFIAVFFIKRAFVLIDVVLLKDSPIGYIDKIIGCAFSLVIASLIACGVTAVFNFAINLPIFEQASYDFTGGLVYGFFNNFNPIELIFSF